MSMNSSFTKKGPLIPQLNLNLLKTKQNESLSSEESESEIPNNYTSQNESLNKNIYDNLIQTWRSLESNLQTNRGDNPQQLQSQILELSSQIHQLIENQNKYEQIREEEESQTKSKVFELINNLEAKNLKISEQNRMLLQEALQGSSLGLSQSLYNGNKTFLGGTVAFLSTLNQIIREEENENEKYLEEQLDNKEQALIESKSTIEQLELEIQKINKDHQFKVKEFELEIKYLKHENQQLSENLNKYFKTQTSSLTSNLNSTDIINLLESMTIDNIMNENINLEKYGLNSKIQSNLKLLINKIKENEFPKKQSYTRNSTIEIFKQQLKRNASFDMTTTKQFGGIEEPTPRFILDQENQKLDQTNQSYFGDMNMTQNSVFQANLTMNRSINHKSKLFNSTLNNIFRKRPTQNDQQKELWTYIFELETELVEMQKQIKKQLDESQLEISVCLGNNQAVKNAKINLETQIEELSQDNMLKTQKIAQLENYNSRLMQTINEASVDESNQTLMQNLRGILSPNQFKKIKKFIQEECQDENQQCDYQNISAFQQEENDSIDRDQSTFFNQKQRLIQYKDSKNSTMSFRQHNLNIETKYNKNEIVFQDFISPVYKDNRVMKKQNQSKKPLETPNNQQKFMLIQDQLNQSAIDLIDMTQDEQYFLNQPSMIIENYSSVGDQSQFLNTHNNKTLQSFLNMNQSKQSSHINGGQKQGGLFGFRKKFMQQSSMNMSKNNRSFQGGQTNQFIIQHMQENFQQQLQELKNEKVKLIQILNKFLNLPNDITSQNSAGFQLEELLQQNTSNDSFFQIPSKQFFEDFRLQVTEALSKHQSEINSIKVQEEKLIQERDKFKEQQEKMEKRRIVYNDKVKKLKERSDEIEKKYQLLDEREKLLDQQELKLKYRKQAMDEEWKRLDKKREELKQQEEMIQKEWDKLGQEVKEVNELRKVHKGKKMQVKEMKAKIDTEKRLMENLQEKLHEETLRMEEREKQLKLKERKVEREQERNQKLKDEMQRDKIEIEKQKEFIKQERISIEQERADLEQKRSLSGMFIPDLKNLVTKMTGKHKSLNRAYINDGNENRIKKPIQIQSYSSAVTNMNAYINKCQCGSNDGIHNCDLHKSMNKSTISLSNLCNYHSNPSINKTISAIGSGRSTYKIQEQSDSVNASKLKLSKAIIREHSYKRGVSQNLTTKHFNNNSMAFNFPSTNRNLPVFDDSNKENNSSMLNGLDSILKGTAKFKESKFKLEQSYNSLIESFNACDDNMNKENLMDTQYSFMTLNDDDNNGQSLSRDEL